MNPVNSVQNFAAHFNWSRVSISSVAFKLATEVFSCALMAITIALMYQNHSSVGIQCISDSFESASEQYANFYCWKNGFVEISEDVAPVKKIWWNLIFVNSNFFLKSIFWLKKSDDGRKVIFYPLSVWMPTILILLAIIAILPKLFWESKEKGTIAKFCENNRSYSNDIELESLAKLFNRKLGVIFVEYILFLLSF
jgi:hypothetical protein